jgi:hypothetical protein
MAGLESTSGKYPENATKVLIPGPHARSPRQFPMAGLKSTSGSCSENTLILGPHAMSSSEDLMLGLQSANSNSPENAIKVLIPGPHTRSSTGPPDTV